MKRYSARNERVLVATFGMAFILVLHMVIFLGPDLLSGRSRTDFSAEIQKHIEWYIVVTSIMTVPTLVIGLVNGQRGKRDRPHRWYTDELEEENEKLNALLATEDAEAVLVEKKKKFQDACGELGHLVAFGSLAPKQCARCEKQLQTTEGVS